MILSSLSTTFHLIALASIDLSCRNQILLRSYKTISFLTIIMSIFLIQHIFFPFFINLLIIVIIIFDALIVLNLVSGSPLSQFLEPFDTIPFVLECSHTF